MTIRLDARFAIVTAAALAALYWLSSIPGRADAHHDPVILFLENLSHAPLFAALAFAWHKTLSRGRHASAGSTALALMAAGTCAVLDEWHQSFVPGRDASVSDLVVDVTGIAAMLVFLQWKNRRASRLHVAVPTTP
jgi:VanZ family protein